VKALVTGAGGLVGGALIDELLKDDDVDVVGLSSAPQAIEHDRLTWITTSICNLPQNIPELTGIDTVFHLAAQTSVYSAKADPLNDLNVNVGGLIGLLDLLRRHALSAHVVIAGTVTNSGLAPRLPVNEATPDQPITFYDLSKLAAEMYLRQFILEGAITGCSLRLANVYGGSKRGQKEDRGVVDKLFKRALGGQNLQVFGDGNYLRDYIHIDDVVSAFIAAARYPHQVNGRHFVIGSGNGIFLKDAFHVVAEVAAGLSNKQVHVEHVPTPEGLSPIEFRNFIADTDAFRAATGWYPKYDLRSGLMKSYGRKT
jgi:nucleoside-diphosphate-sugar epimerase